MIVYEVMPKCTNKYLNKKCTYLPGLVYLVGQNLPGLVYLVHRG